MIGTLQLVRLTEGIGQSKDKPDTWLFDLFPYSLVYQSTGEGHITYHNR